MWGIIDCDTRKKLLENSLENCFQCNQTQTIKDSIQAMQLVGDGTRMGSLDDTSPSYKLLSWLCISKNNQKFVPRAQSTDCITLFILKALYHPAVPSISSPQEISLNPSRPTRPSRCINEKKRNVDMRYTYVCQPQSDRSSNIVLGMDN